MSLNKIVVCGACGRMGMSIIRLAGLDSSLEVSGMVDSKTTEVVVDSIEKINKPFNVIIDFTSIEGTLSNLDIALKGNKAIVIGTTGLIGDNLIKIKAAAKKIPIVFSPNMSMGINILFKLAKDAAKALPGYDLEIVELHHNQKKDAPSGTAAKLAEIIAEATGRDMKNAGIYGRHGLIGARKQDEIGVMSVRGGDIVGEHTLYLVGAGERLELTHMAHSRDTLAAGALHAAKWLVNQKPGLYDMQDVLGLN